MKSVSISILLLACFNFSFCQGVFNNKTNAALQKVIQDYPNRFNNIKGDTVVQNQQTTDFQSKVEVPGALHCVITKYGSSEREMFSWSCLIFKSGEFEVAKAKFKDLYNEIRNTVIKIEGEKPFILNGSFNTPIEEKKYATILFQLLPSSAELKKLKVELSMHYQVSEWKIQLVVYDKDGREVADPVASAGYR